MSGPRASGAAGTAQVQTISLYVKPEKIYPRSVSGVFARWRWGMVALTQLVFYGVPWLNWNGRQAVLFDLETPRFYVFGLVLHPQDLIYLAALLVVSALALFFFTAVAGRLWCGYACPQTVYTELFLWIERRTEGDRQARMRLDRGPWTLEKLRRKGAKHALWLLLAGWTGFTFVGYFLPIRSLAPELVAGGAMSWPAFWVALYGLATYGNAGWMREQICTYMCPYARFQSTLIDADSLVIAYDTGRGEPRGSRSRQDKPAERGLGDCVDCTLCVQVCPTGIDIRKGLQNECIGCAACIDVCDNVMDKMGYRPGLIRYGTANGVAQGLTRPQMLRRLWRPRVAIYGALLLGGMAAMATGLATRGPVVVDVMRDRGALGRIGEDGGVENVYRMQLLNRQERPASYVLAVRGLDGIEAVRGEAWQLGPGEVRTFTATLRLPQPQAAALEPGSHPIEVMLTTPGGTGAVVVEKSTFVVPR
jgi:cytochrome c oxidase accessory protein FixG